MLRVSEKIAPKVFSKKLAVGFQRFLKLFFGQKRRTILWCDLGPPSPNYFYKTVYPKHLHNRCDNLWLSRSTHMKMYKNESITKEVSRKV